MAQFASSNFNGTDGDTIETVDANWIQHPTSTRPLQIVGNRARQGGSTGTGAYYYDAAPAGADYDVSFTLYHPGTLTGSTMGTTGRMSTSANTFYHARVSVAGTLQLFKNIAGTFTSLGSSSRTVSSGGSYLIELRMAGTAIELWWDGEGSAAVSATDSAISAAGYPGIRSTTSTTPTDTLSWQIEDFSADEAGGGASQTIAFTLEDVTAAAIQTLSHDQALTGALDDVTVSISQTAQHDQALSATLDDVTVAISQTLGNATIQTLAVVLDDVTVAVSQTLSHAQALAATLDGVTVDVAQTLNHSQALAETLDGITVEINQSAAPSQKDQALAITLDDIEFDAVQVGALPAVGGMGFTLVDMPSTMWWKRKPKAITEEVAKKKIKRVVRAIQEVAQEQASEPAKASQGVAQQQREVYLAIAPLLAEMPGFDWKQVFRLIVAQDTARRQMESAIARAKQIEQDDEDVLMLLLSH